MSDWKIAGASGLAAVVAIFATTPIAAQPFELAVRKDQVFGARRGMLVFTIDDVAYRTPDGQDARQWAYDDVKQIQILSPTRVRVVTYEDQGWFKLGADRTYDFEVTGEPVSEDLVAYLLDRVSEPLVMAVVPEVDSDPLFQVPVKLRQRIRGSHGSLELLGDRLVYRTDRTDHTRVWRLGDLYLVFQPDRHRLTVQAYEGGGDQTRAFEFDLKRPLPPGALEVIWKGMYRSSRVAAGQRQ